MILDELVGTRSWRVLRIVQRSLKCFFYGRGFAGDSVGKESTCNVGDPSSIPGLGRSPGKGKGYPLPYSSLENSMNRGTWWATVHGVTKSQTPLSDLHVHFSFFYGRREILRKFQAQFDIAFGGQKGHSNKFVKKSWNENESQRLVMKDLVHHYEDFQTPQRAIERFEEGK